MDDFSKISPIRNKFLGESRPVSTLVEVSRLTVPGCVIEIDLTALKQPPSCSEFNHMVYFNHQKNERGIPYEKMQNHPYQ